MGNRLKDFNSTTETRRHQRWDIFEFAKIITEDQESEPTIIVDLSLGGFQIRSKVAYTVGDTVVASIQHGEEEPLKVHAEVRYSTALPDSSLFATGLRFTPASGEERVALVNFIHERFRAEMSRMQI